MRSNVPRYLSPALSFAWGALTALVALPAQAALSLSNTPLFLTVSVPPNVVLTLDDSGSMRRAYVPENCADDASDCVELDNKYEKSSKRNLIHYNPNITYLQPKGPTGTTLSTTFNDAYRNGFDRTGTTSTRVNLSNAYRPTASLNLNTVTGLGEVTETYMGHDSTFVRCNTTASTPRCQYLTGTTTWNTVTSSSCPSSLGSEQVRHDYCRGTHFTNVRCRTSSSQCEYSTNYGSSYNTITSSSCPSSLGDRDRRDRHCENTHGTGYTPVATPAYYYVFDPTNHATQCAETNPTAVTNNTCYDRRMVGAAEQQNFANWYSFARTRNLATQTAASLAFETLDPTVRLGWQALNSCNSGASGLVDADCDGWKNNFSSISNGIRPFTSTHRENFVSWVQQQPTNSGTPLPAATARVGAYYQTETPYRVNVDDSSSEQLRCRRNYHILMTDGIWTTGQGGTPQDTATYNLPETINGISQYQPMAPYSSASTDTLADVAFRYSVTDLRDDLDNEVTPVINDTVGSEAEIFWNPKNDPYTWQHMVNFTIGLGLSSFLGDAGLTWAGDTYTGSYPQLANGTTAWPAATPGAANPGNVSDLWHAAINSRGKFFSADDPASLARSFREVLNAITGDAGSSAALSANSTSIQPGNTYVYQAKFDKDWSGTLLSFKVNDDTGIVTGPPNWDASAHIPDAAFRNIFTYNTATGMGVDFKLCSALSPNQQDFLETNSSGVDNNLYCQNRLDWLRGSRADEQSSETAGSLKMFRNRPTNKIMGDIVNSDPAYVKAVDYGYSDLPDGVGTAYAAYLSANSPDFTVGGRMPVVYVGSNDGRLYGIRATVGPIPAIPATATTPEIPAVPGDANAGTELFSFIPGGVYRHLARLSDPVYSHRFFVDGGVTAGDAYLTIGATAAWRTIVTGGLNAGGKSIYALNVTNPLGFSAVGAVSNVVLWEYNSAETDPDMGYTYSQPQIGLMQNGTDWVAVFGNGYNSTEGGAFLYIVNLATGALLRKIPVGTNVTGVDDNNGLSTPYLHDTNGDKKIDVIYAGDLQGNLWKFDVTGTSASWNVAFAGQPLFTAKDASGNVQSITSQPKVGGNPHGGDMVVFGTGRYMSVADITDMSVQTYYGIRDYGNTPITTTNRSELQQQTISLQLEDQFERDVRTISNEVPDWTTERGWYLDLLDPPNVALGERVVSTSLIRLGRVIFVTITPSQDPCEPGGSSWLMELDLVNGGTFADSILDLNDDNQFNSEDEVQGEVVSGVRTSTLGISKTPVWLDAQNKAFKILTGTRGSFVTEKNATPNPPPPTGGSVSRRSWIQIR